MVLFGKKFSGKKNPNILCTIILDYKSLYNSTWYKPTLCLKDVLGRGVGYKRGNMNKFNWIPQISWIRQHFQSSGKIETTKRLYWIYGRYTGKTKPLYVVQLCQQNMEKIKTYSIYLFFKIKKIKNNSFYSMKKIYFKNKYQMKKYNWIKNLNYPKYKKNTPTPTPYLFIAKNDDL